MKSEHNKNKKFNITILVSCILIILFVFGLIRERFNSAQVKNEIDGLEKQISSYQQENTELGHLISDWQSGDRVEKEARLKLGLKKPGENVVIIMRTSAATTSSTIGENSSIIAHQIQNDVSRGDTNPQKWLYYFFPLKKSN